jgi:hypothetical protein
MQLKNYWLVYIHSALTCRTLLVFLVTTNRLVLTATCLHIATHIDMQFSNIAFIFYLVYYMEMISDICKFYNNRFNILTQYRFIYCEITDKTALRIFFCNYG